MKKANRTVLLGAKRILHPPYSTSSGEWSKDEYQFLEKSTLPTYHFQKSLRRLPIPKLEKTCERYIRAIRPLLTQQQLERTQRIVKTFQEEEGKELQAALVGHDNQNKHTSYITEPWFDIYLRSRKAVPINYNPFMAFAPDPVAEYNEELVRATNMVLAIGRFKKSLDAQVLTPEVFHLKSKWNRAPLFTNVTKMLPESVSWYGAVMFSAFPLDMSQHPNLFNTSRIPHVGKDSIFQDSSQRHLMVMRMGHFFTVDLFKKDGSLVTPSELYTCFHHIMSLPLDSEPNPVGVFTCLERDEWAHLREELLGVGGENADVLRKIDGSLFCLCLGEKSGQAFHREHLEPYLRRFLHGDGKNRWFDKSFTLIVSEFLACVNFEHSWGDGVAVLRLMEDMQKDSCTKHFVGPETQPSDSVDVSQFVRKLEFKLNDRLKTTIHNKLEEYNSWCKSLGFTAVEYEGMNRNYLKKNKLSPDGIMQLSIQMAFYKKTGTVVPTYESCSTSAFRHGRTETMRPVTSASKRCVQAFVSQNRPPAQELRAMIHEASKDHAQLVRESSLGQGFDRHLLGLDITASRLGRKRPELFEDEVWNYVNHYILSTSTLNTDTIVLGGFGPVVKNGFGIGYNIEKERLGYIVSAYPPHRNPEDFKDCMNSCLEDIHQVLDHTKVPS